MSTLFSDAKVSEQELDKIREVLLREEDESEREALDALLFDALRQAKEGNADFAPAPAHEVKAKWAELAAGLGFNPDIEHYHESRRKRMPVWRAAMWAAAVMVPAVLVVSALLFSREHKGADAAIVATTVTTSSPEAFKSTSTTVATRQDEIHHITLPDGTVVTLNRNAKLAYNSNREVELSGEAYFKVAKDPEHPFVIYTNDLKVTVHGTEFNLNTQAANQMSKLSLYEGHVELEYLSGRRHLKNAGHEFVLEHATGVASVTDFDTAQQPQWMNEAPKRIMSLGEIFDQIEVQYGVEIENRAAVDQSRQLKFSVGGELDGVMSRLEYLSDDFSCTIDGSAITITTK